MSLYVYREDRKEASEQIDGVILDCGFILDMSQMVRWKRSEYFFWVGWLGKVFEKVIFEI